MSDQQSEQVRREALESASRAGRSANRARFWAGLNRYLAAEAEHEHKVAREERADEDQTPGKPGKPGKHAQRDDSHGS